ncbi:restriction endonuclease subunit S [Nostoc sphaeroides]|nr:restriction endonuclease subunit S [Nostoc sphaeroides]
MRNGKLSQIPEGWQWRKFGDCAKLINGRAYSQEELLDSGTPVLRIQNLNGGDRWYYSNLKLPEEKYCEAGDLLYAWSASFGPYRFSGTKSIFHYHIWRVIPNEKLDKAFAYRLLEWITEEIKSAAHGVAMLHMTKSGMEEWLIPLPPLEEQRRIAEVLDRAEELRSKRREAIAQLDTLTQAIFIEMFGNNPPLESGWDIVKFGDLIEVLTDYHANGSYEILRDNVVLKNQIDYALMVRTTDLENNNFENNCIYIDEKAYNFLSKSKVYGGEIIINKIGSAGKVYLMPYLKRPVSLGMNAFLIRLNNKVNTSFIYYFLTSSYGKEAINKNVKGAVTKTITKEAIRGIKTPVPPLHLQQEFARRVEAVEKLKAAHRASLSELDALFASLQHRAFRGEL